MRPAIQSPLHSYLTAKIGLLLSQQVDPVDRYFQSSCPCGYTFLPRPTPSDDRGDVSLRRHDHDRSEALAVSEREGGDVAIGYPSVVSHLIASVPVRGQRNVVRPKTSHQHDGPIIDPPLLTIWHYSGSTMDGSTECDGCASILLANLLA
jgi:hypothetical protein